MTSFNCGASFVRNDYVPDWLAQLQSSQGCV